MNNGTGTLYKHSFVAVLKKHENTLKVFRSEEHAQSIDFTMNFLLFKFFLFRTYRTNYAKRELKSYVWGQ